MRRLLTVALVVVALVTGSTPTGSAGSAALRWQARDLGTLGGRWSRAVALNDRGVVVGWSSTAPTGKPYRIRRGFVWKDGVMRELAPRRGLTISTNAFAVTDDGVVLGDWIDLGEHEPLVPEIFNWRAGTFTTVGAGFATAIDGAGDVIGQADITAYEEGHAFLWRRGGSSTRLGEVAGRMYSVANAVNDHGAVVGGAYDLTVTGSFAHARSRAVLWGEGVPRDLGLLAGTNECEATGINERSWVIGTCDVGHRFANGEFSGMPDWKKERPIGFLWHGRMIRLPGLPTGIAADGSVVGTVGNRAFMWKNGKTTSLRSLRAQAKTVAIAIDDRGQILGTSGGRVVVWQGGHVYDLGPGSPSAVNALGWVVGVRGGHATLWISR